MVLHLDPPPLNESSVVVFTEKALLSGTILSAIFYGTRVFHVLGSNTEGIHLTIFLQCAHVLWTRRKTTPYSYLLLSYIVATFALGTSTVISLSISNQYMFIDYRNILGGPIAFEAVSSSTPDGLVVAWSSVLGDWLIGGLLVS